MVLRLDEDAVPDTWSLWFDRQAAEAHTEVCMFYRSTNFWFSQFHQADDRFEWLDVFPYRKGDDIVEQKNVFFLPLSQPLHGKDPRPVVTPSASTSSLKRPRPRTSFLNFLGLHSNIFPLQLQSQRSLLLFFPARRQPRSFLTRRGLPLLVPCLVTNRSVGSYYLYF